jgi:hypothetical protein
VLKVPETSRSAFEQAAARPHRSGPVREMIGLLAHNKKWWLFPVVVVLLLMGALLLLSGTAVAPFIYTLF